MDSNSTQPNPNDVASYVALGALSRGIDPQIAVRMFANESGLDPKAMGDDGSSFGVPQLHYGGVSRTAPHPGLGDEFTAATGMHAADPANWRQAIDFGLDKAREQGWAPWKNTRDKLGLSNYAGITPKGRSSSAAPAPDFLTDFEASPPQQPSSAPAPAPSGAPPASAKTKPKGSVSLAPPSFVPPPDAPAAAPSANASNPAADLFTDFEVAPPAEVLQAPAVQNPSPVANASATGFATGVPVIGPYLNEGLDRVQAAIMSLASDKPYSNALALVHQRENQDVAAHPTANALGQVGGAIAGTVPLMALAPAAFGVSADGVGVNALRAAATGAALGGADSLTRNGFDTNALAHNAISGAGFGFAGPVAGKVIGSGVNAFSNLFNRTTPAARNIANALSSEGMSVPETRNALAAAGPQATLPDISPALALKTGALAESGGAPTSILKIAYLARAAGANERVGNAVDQYLGSRPDLAAAQEGIQKTASTSAAPFYNAARASAEPMDISPVLSHIDSELPAAAGGVKNVLETAKGYLTKKVASVPGADGKTIKMIVPKDDPQSLLSARQALDDFIERRGGAETTAGKNALRQASIVRSKLDEVLKSDPNIAAGDAAYSKEMRNLSALNEGTQLFKPGTRIEDVRRSLAGKSGEEIQAMRTGTLSAIHDALDNARQGDFAAARSLFSKSAANRAKLDALFPNADKIFDTVGHEINMRAVEQMITGGSKTAGINAAREEFKPKQGNALSVLPALIGEHAAGIPGALAGIAAKSLWNDFTNALAESSRSKLMKGLAEGLSSTGLAQHIFLDQIERAARSARSTNALSSAASTGSNLLLGHGGNALAKSYLNQH